MINKAEQLAASCGLAYLEATTRFVEEGDLWIARLLVEEAIRLSGDVAGPGFRDRLLGLSASIYGHEQIENNDVIPFPDHEYYYSGTGADGRLTVVDASRTNIVH